MPLTRRRATDKRRHVSFAARRQASLACSHGHGCEGGGKGPRATTLRGLGPPHGGATGRPAAARRWPRKRRHRFLDVRGTKGKCHLSSSSSQRLSSSSNVETPSPRARGAAPGAPTRASGGADLHAHSGLMTA